MASMTVPSSFVISLILIPTTLLFLLFRKLFRERRRVAGLPGPPHHWLFGHIPVFFSVLKTVPPNLHFLMLHALLTRVYNISSPVYYLDLWPLSDPVAIVQSGALAAQITQTRSLPKDPASYKFVGGFMGKFSIGPALDGDGKHSTDEAGKTGFHRFWRSIFNPGFSFAHLQTLTPLVVEKATIFAANLDSYTKSGDIFTLETLTSRLTMDIIGMLVIHRDLDTQSGRPNELVATMRMVPKYVRPIGSLNPFLIYSPIRMLKHAFYERKLDKMIGHMLDGRFAERAAQRLEDGDSGSSERAREIVDLALESYEKETGHNSKVGKQMDPDFRRIAIANIRGFLFAGHDTTSSTLTYAYHLLDSNPTHLATLRRELATVFASISSTAIAKKITDNPSLLAPSTLPFTNAVINETLRLFPAAGTVRTGQPNLHLIDPETGETYPTYADGAAFPLFIGGFAVHRNSANFPNPDVFDPLRFLPSSFLAPGSGNREMSLEKQPKDAFRPFEKGARHCIGLELAYLELRAVLAITVGRFDVITAYGHDQPVIMGDCAFPVLDVVAKPVGGLPVRVRFSSE